MVNEVALKVGMTCGGCEAAVRKVLGKLDGVQSVDVDLPSQKVLVKGDVTPEAVVSQVSKTGKPTELWK
ncbi:hypothetical protein WJX74_004421 [Apatococcus lobatus]|uniref:HMA domain-containing protein n=1 Tax=Apatococcus lobatus TaxID=904363 RepID=A0AAW1Q8X6_9CHLO